MNNFTQYIEQIQTSIETRGEGILVLNTQDGSTTFMSGSDIEGDLFVTEDDVEVQEYLTELLNLVDNNDFTQYGLINVISNEGSVNHQIKF